MTLKALAEKRKPYAADHPRAKVITKQIAEMIAVDLQPFSIVDVGFVASWLKLSSGMPYLG